MRSWTLLILGALAALTGCAPEAAPLRYPGPTGYLSDRPSPLALEPIPPARLAAAPRYDALLDDGRLQIAAVFGQMDTDALAPDDPGFWSQETLAMALIDAGFELRGETRPAGGRRYVGQAGGVAVELEVFGPEQWRFDAVRGRALLADVIAAHEVVYLNGHAKQAHLDVLWDPATYPGPRLLFMDICWSYSMYTPQIVEAGEVQVVNVPNRVVTGSVESLLILLDALLAPDRPGWLSIVRALNERAEVRAAARFEDVEAKLRDPEIYGVSGL